ncbi:carotenoid biosynthesis protein [Synechococcales cyanobacterium C]|uniref:Carotenoid biosynthesis protein n=1 Tax=Petrachloros mirabilis ULC683 TaxID=2781853 RepID=A0A8K2A224_9CYAN|nr:carotenoid biosynthesis protein [Petrachloros mirabilis]NCJ08413.1 carotenoid biosynthesis protein [Petrachloros mirabilis ULC683]
MKSLIVAERVCLTTHLAALLFGLAGLVWVLPHPDFILSLPPLGQRLFHWSMAGGGVVYIIAGALTMALHGYRRWGWQPLLSFMGPAVGLSLGSELLGTSTGFPFGHYAYLDGLGYKIASLVPFTIPLSWFYLGFAAYILAYVGLGSKFGRSAEVVHWAIRLAAVGLGAILLTAWDLVLDPAMSQAPVPFWQFQEVGAFFGMPYRNLAGWVGTGVLFMTVAALLWRRVPVTLGRQQLTVPLAVYLANFAFGAVITLTLLDSQFQIPVLLGVMGGVLPALALWRMTPAHPPVLESTAEAVVSLGIPVGASQK